MFNNNNVPFTMPVQPAGTGTGFGDTGGGWFMWFLIIILLFAGWGNNGWGNGGGGVQENYVLTTDMATMERKIDDVNNGLCNGFYTQAQLVNGVTQSIADSNYTIQNAITNNRIAAMQDMNALTAQMNANEAARQACCCETNNLLATNFGNLKYDMAAQDCQIRQTVNDVGRNLADVQNENTRAVLAAIQGIKDDAKDAKIAELTAQINRLDLAASQQAQNAYLIDQLGCKPPIAAFQVAPPWQYINGGCGCNC